MKRIILIMALAALTACSSIQVATDWDPGVDFSQFQSFALLENEDSVLSRLQKDRIVAAILSDLASKGLEVADSVDEADLAIGWDVATENRTSYQTVHSGMGASSWRHSNTSWGVSTGTSRTTQRNYTVGTLVIAAFETTNKELVWESAGSGTISSGSGPEQSEQFIADAVERILREFPPK